MLKTILKCKSLRKKITNAWTHLIGKNTTFFLWLSWVPSKQIWICSYMHLYNCRKHVGTTISSSLLHMTNYLEGQLWNRQYFPPLARNSQLLISILPQNVCNGIIQVWRWEQVHEEFSILGYKLRKDLWCMKRSNTTIIGKNFKNNLSQMRCSDPVKISKHRIRIIHLIFPNFKINMKLSFFRILNGHLFLN